MFQVCLDVIKTYDENTGRLKETYEVKRVIERGQTFIRFLTKDDKLVTLRGDKWVIEN